MAGLWHILVEDLILQHELRVACLRNYAAFKCPCSNCKGGIRKSVRVIKQHLCEVPRDRFLYHSMVGEDPPGGFPAHGIWMPATEGVYEGADECTTDANGNEYLDSSTIEFLDLEHDVQQQVFDALYFADRLVEEPFANTDQAPEFEDES